MTKQPKKKILVSNPQLSYLALKNEIDEATIQFYENPIYILGEHVAKFETNFANYLGINHAIGVANGTDAILLALKAYDIGVGDEVITVSLTAVATVSAIEQSGASPVLVDVDLISKTIDVQKISQVITSKTKAMVAVHLYGQPADLDALTEICKKHHLILIEDCAQAHGAIFKDKYVGTFGHVSTFSFYPTKNLGAIGDGGMVVTNDKHIADKVRRLRQYGWDRPQFSIEPGINSRLDGLQAVILDIKLKHLDSSIKKRQSLAEYYTKSLTGLPINLPSSIINTSHAYHLYVIKLHDANLRHVIIEYLKQFDIFVGVHYPYGVHQQPAYTNRIKTSSLKNTEQLTESIISLPMYPELTHSEAEYVVSKLCDFFKRHD